MKSAEFKKIVTKELAPFLRENGWKGSGFDYTKHVGSIIRALTIQPSSSGGKFCIEIGIHFDFIPIIPEIDLSKIKTWNMDIRTRLTPNEASDYWWEFPTTERNTATLFQELKSLILESPKTYFNKYDDWKERVPVFSAESIENGETKSFINKPPIRTALILARLNVELGNKERALEFSKYGLSKIVGHKGSGLIPQFEEIIQTAS